MIIDPFELGLEVHGRNDEHEYYVICPFHDDHAPSACFNAARGLFYCFVCGATSKAEKLIKTLGGRLQRVSSLSTRVQKIDLITNRILAAPLALNNEYLKSRKIENETVQHFSIRALNNAVGIIFEMNGKVTGSQVRITDKRSELRYLTFGQKPPFWPVEPLTSGFVLTEGIFGVFNAYQHGVFAKSILGVGSVRNSGSILSYFDFYIMFDNDTPGIEATKKLLFASHYKGKPLYGYTADELKDWSFLTKR